MGVSSPNATRIEHIFILLLCHYAYYAVLMPFVVSLIRNLELDLYLLIALSDKSLGYKPQLLPSSMNQQ